MKKQTQAIHLAYERRDAYDSLSVPVYNTLAYEFDNAQIMSEAFTDKIKAPDYSRVENPTVTNFELPSRVLTMPQPSIRVWLPSATLSWRWLLRARILSLPSISSVIHMHYCWVLSVVLA